MKKTLNNEFQEFYLCSVCGNLIIKLNDSGISPQCCGRDMNELVPNNTEFDFEKHIPVCHLEGSRLIVNVGENEHPMTPDHYIQWIFVKTSKGAYVKYLTADDNPDACFKLCHDEEIKEVYCYCNRHGLWKSDCNATLNSMS